MVAARSEHEITETALEIADRGGLAEAVRLDVTDRGMVDAMFADVHSRFGPIDTLVNNAGTHLAIGQIWEVDPDEWVRHVETNLHALFYCSRAALPKMVSRGTGRIINISSGAATEPRPYSVAYTAAKTGAQRFSESVARAVEPLGVKIFSLNPGPVLTQLNTRNRDSAAWKRWYPEQSGMEYFPAERAAAYALSLAAGEADALSGRFISTVDDLRALIEAADHVNETDARRLAIRG